MSEQQYPKPSEVMAQRAKNRSRPGERDDPYKVAQIYQGGAMKVALPAGAALAQRQLFGDSMPLDRFDGTSSGVPPWMYILAGKRHAEGMSIPYDELSRGFISLRNLLSKGRIVNLDLMNDAFRVGYKSLDFENIIHHPVETHVYATSVTDGKVVDFQIGREALNNERGLQTQGNGYVYFCHTAEDVAKAIAATTHLPFYGGRPVPITETIACVDGGISAAGRVPLRRAIASGASHVLVFTTEKVSVKRSKSVEEKFAAWWIRRHYPGIADYWVGHNEHLDTLNMLEEVQTDLATLPLIEVVRVPDEQIPSSKETRPQVLYKATLAGRAAMLAAFEPYNLDVGEIVEPLEPRIQQG